MATPTVEQLIAPIPSGLGSHGPLLHKIESLLHSPESNLSSVGDLIERDPSLTARLLRFANSPFCGFPARLGTVSEAIRLLGVQQVQDIIMVSSVLERFEGVTAEFVTVEEFWKHNLACGIAGRLLARERRLPKADRFFVVGLLHDIGRLVLYSQAPQLMQQIFELYSRERLLLHDAEKTVLGFDHQQIAKSLLGHWKYPDAMVEAIAHHHYPQRCGFAMIETAVVHVADHLVSAMQLGHCGERFVPPLEPTAWSLLGLSHDALAGVVAGIDEQLDAVSEMFLH